MAKGKRKAKLKQKKNNNEKLKKYTGFFANLISLGIPSSVFDKKKEEELMLFCCESCDLWVLT